MTGKERIELALQLKEGDCIAATLENPIKDIARHKEYVFPDPAASHRFKSLEKALDRFGDRRAVILNTRDGFSDLRDLLGYEEALIQLQIECRTVDPKVEVSSFFGIEY